MISQAFLRKGKGNLERHTEKTIIKIEAETIGMCPQTQKYRDS